MTGITKSGISLIIIGFGIVLIGTIIYAGNANFGGLIMIGPIPLAFGSSPGMTVIAMVIGLLTMIVFLLLGRRSGNSSGVEERISYEDTKEDQVKGGGVILIGPIPIVFGSDKKHTLIIMVLAIVIMVLAIVFLK
ncbi:Uncharacterised protein [uncultured archaeon]|nr:Uncharacterised protein [uncultured archaeon]